MTRLLGSLLLTAATLPAACAGFAQPSDGCGPTPWAQAMVAGGPILSLELARTPEEHARGLMFRESMDGDHGMLFVFERQTNAAFWMRNTLIPLSVAYVGQDGVIVDIQDMQPLDETPHPPARPYWYALEVNQGWFAANGVAVGDTLAFCLQAS